MDFIKLFYVVMINIVYLVRCVESIDVDKLWCKVKVGNLYGDVEIVMGMLMELFNILYFFIVDKEGNVVLMIISIEFMFGLGIMVGGFLLNNQFIDFLFLFIKNCFFVLNRVEFGKCLCSVMSLMMVFDDKGDFEVVIGLLGGLCIISYVV